MMWRLAPGLSILPILLIGFSVGQPVSPNYRWCLDARAGVKCFASQTACVASRRGRCELRLVAEPMRSGQPNIPR